MFGIDPLNNTSGVKMQLGTYVGDGGNQSIALGWPIDFLMIWRSGSYDVVFKTINMPYWQTPYLSNVADIMSGAIVSVELSGVAGTFQVGANAATNANGALYHYLAVGGRSGGLARGHSHSETMGYTGTDEWHVRTPFRPHFVFGACDADSAQFGSSGLEGYVKLFTATMYDRGYTKYERDGFWLGQGSAVWAPQRRIETFALSASGL